MTARVRLGATGVLAVVGLGVAGYLAWRTYRATQDAAGAVSELWRMGGQKIDAAASAGLLTPMLPSVIGSRIGSTLRDALGISERGALSDGMDALASAASSRQETAGGLLRSVTSDDEARIQAMLQGSGSTTTVWSTAGRWNNPSAYVSPGVTGDGGAAFGIYPKP